MLDRISQVAEKAATSVSRRNFLGQLGRGAAILAGALGGLLATADARAGGNKGLCCAVFNFHNPYGPTSCTKRSCKDPGGPVAGDDTLRTVNCADYPWVCPQ